MAWTQFLTKLHRPWRRLFTRQSGNDQPPSAAPAVLGRFVDDKKNISSTGRVKRRVFDPPKSNLRLSVYQLDDLTDAEIWLIADRFVGAIKGRLIIGRAELVEARLAPLGLRAESDPHPHPRHMNIVGWPDEKDARMSVALELAEQSKYIARSDGVKPEPTLAPTSP
jgi:hypothetical protein